MSLWQFIVATLFLFPKIILVVFVGSRIAKFSDGNQREQMDRSETSHPTLRISDHYVDPATLILNIVSTVISISAGILAGMYVGAQLERQLLVSDITTYSITFRLLKRQINELRVSGTRDGELAAEGIEEAEEGAPLLRSSSFDNA